MKNNKSSYRTWQRNVLTVSWITYASFYLCKANIGAALPQIRRSLNIDSLAISVIPANFKLVFGIGQFVSGIIGDHINPKYLITLGMIGALLANFFFGFGKTLGFLVILWGFNGLFQSMGWPPLVKIISRWFSSSNRGKAMGIISTSYLVGAALSLISAGLIVNHIGWRYAFIIPALIMAILTIYFFKSIKISPREVGLDSIVDHSSNKSQSSSKLKKLNYTLKYTLINPKSWLIALSCAAIGIVRYVYIDWGPSYIMETQNITISQATYQISAVQFGGVMGSIAIGWLADHFFGERRFPIVLASLISLAFFVLIHNYITQINLILGVFCLFMIGFTTYGPFAILTGAEVQDLGGKHAVSSVSGFVGALSYIGAFLGDIATGWSTKNYGWQGGIIFWASSALFAALVIIPLLIKQYKEN